MGRQIKAAAERGIRIITASVPHRSDDVVRSNPELRGRVTAIDTDYWTIEELRQIAYKGFRALNVELAPAVERQLAQESFGSPQLMQSICLTLCFERGWTEALTRTCTCRIRRDRNEPRLRAHVGDGRLLVACGAASRGPRQRGTERREFDLTDGTRGDVYRCVLLAIAQGTPLLNIPYERMMERVKAVCINGESPVGSSVSEALVQMHKIVNELSVGENVLEWMRTSSTSPHPTSCSSSAARTSFSGSGMHELAMPRNVSSIRESAHRLDHGRGNVVRRRSFRLRRTQTPPSDSVNHFGGMVTGRETLVWSRRWTASRHSWSSSPAGGWLAPA